MLRVIDELRPRAVIGENVDGIVNMALDQVLSDLESIGYETGPPIILPACGVDAPHRRYRVFVWGFDNVADCDLMRMEGTGSEQSAAGIGREGKNVAHTRSGGFRKSGICKEQQRGTEVVSASQDVADSNNAPSTRQREYGGERLPGAETDGSCKGGYDVADTPELAEREPTDKADAFTDGRKAWEIAGGRSEYVENPAVCNDRTKIECNKTNRPHPGRPTGGISGSGWWPTQPGLGGMLDGLSARLDQHRWPAGPGEPQYSWEPPRIAQGVKNRKDRLKALGNAVNPYQIFPVLYFMAQIIRAQKAGKIKDYSY